MDLRDWRKAQDPKLTLAVAAPLMGLPLSSLSDLENGKVAAVSCETLSRIMAVTAGAVTLDDIFRSWKFANLDQFTAITAEGRAAWKAIRATRQPARKKTNGKSPKN